MTFFRRHSGFLFVACLIASAASNALAQTSTGTISGVTSDTQGGRVPHAKITVTNLSTSVSTAVESDGDGVYSVASLPIGNYKIEVQHQGFKSAIRNPVVLTVGKDDVEDFVMDVGDISQAVEVQGEASTVETATSSVGWLVGQQQIRDLPLNGRNYAQLTLLAPGVQPVPQENTEGASTLVPFGFGSPQRFSVAGGRPQGELFLIDGTDTAGVWGNSTGANLIGTTLGVDGIAEFEVLTNTYTADYGGNGAALNAALRSGTNDIHGSVYEFARNSALDAKNYFNPTVEPLPFTRNQFGGTFGGPIVKNKTFYFVNYEGLKQDLTTPITTDVPDQNFRNGYLPCNLAFGFPCNMATMLAHVGVNPAVQSYLNTFPLPNGMVFPGSGIAQNIASLDSPILENYGAVRVDHNFNDSNSLFVSYVVDDATLTAHPQPVLTDNDRQRNQYLSAEEKKIISPTMLNVFHFGYVRSLIDVATVFNPNLTIVPNSGVNGGIDVLGLSGIGSNDDSLELVNRFTLRDQLSFTKGRHSVDVGLEVVRHFVDADIPIINGGVAAYLPVGPISSFEAFLLNTPLLFEGVPLNGNDSSRRMRHTNLSPYVQDRFQVSRRFTLNLGVRYDFETNPIEVNDKLYTLINPYTSTTFTRVPNAFQHNITKWNFQPRVGFAWDVFGNQKTAVRGGFGAFADLPLEMQTMISYLFNPPIYNIQEILFPTIPNPFSGGGIHAGLPSAPQITAYNSPINDYIMEYNLNVQQQLFRNTVLTVGYIGSKANHLFIGQETNPCLPTSILPDGTIVRAYANPAACPTENPALASVVDRFPVGTSNYNSLQVALDKSLGKNLQFRTAYTYSKCLDYGSYYTGNDSIGPNGQTAGLQAGNLANTKRNVDYGPCDYDVRNNWTSNAVYQLPFSGNRFKDGWQLTGIVSVHSGTPYSVYDGIDQANVGDAGAAENAERPDVIGTNDNPTGIVKTGTGVYGFNPSVFVLQPAGVFDDLGRNTLVAPGVRDVDLGIAKATRISERTNLLLRMDVFNVANHTNFGFPNAALFIGVGVRNPAAGQITATSTTSRQLQLSAKFSF